MSLEIESLRQQLKNSLLEKSSTKGSLLTKWSAYRQAVQSRIERESSRSSQDLATELEESGSYTAQPARKHQPSLQQDEPPSTPSVRPEGESMLIAASRGSPILPLNAHTGDVESF